MLPEAPANRKQAEKNRELVTVDPLSDCSLYFGVFVFVVVKTDRSRRSGVRRCAKEEGGRNRPLSSKRRPSIMMTASNGKEDRKKRRSGLLSITSLQPDTERNGFRNPNKNRNSRRKGRRPHFQEVKASTDRPHIRAAMRHGRLSGGERCRHPNTDTPTLP